MSGDGVSRKDERYSRRIAKGLDRAFNDKATETIVASLEELRLVVFSDHHKGARDGADDFRRCERAYNAALAYYFEMGYQLYLLGDARGAVGVRCREGPQELLAHARARAGVSQARAASAVLGQPRRPVVTPGSARGAPVRFQGSSRARGAQASSDG